MKPAGSATSDNLMLGIAWGVVGVLLFSATLPMIAIALEEFSWEQTLMIRLSVGVLLALALVAWLPRPDWSDWPSLMAISGGVVLGFPLLTTLALRDAPASHGAVVIAILPMSIAAVAVLISHERLSLRFWIASAVGAMVVVICSLVSGGGEFMRADILLVAAVAVAAVGYAFGGRLARKIGGPAVIVWGLVLSTPLILGWLMFSLFSGDFEWSWDVSAPTVLAACYLGIFSQVVGFFFWYRGLAIGGIAKVSQVMLLQPFCTIAISAIIVGETIGWMTVLFSVLVVLCVAVALRSTPPTLNG